MMLHLWGALLSHQIQANWRFWSWAHAQAHCSPSQLCSLQSSACPGAGAHADSHPHVATSHARWLLVSKEYSTLCHQPVFPARSPSLSEKPVREWSCIG